MTRIARGIRNNNPGNIRKAGDWRKWQGLAANQTDREFLVFASPVDGIRALARTLITYYDKRFAGDGSKIDTVAEVIARWAPPAENNTSMYAAAVAQHMGQAPSDPVDLHAYADLRPMVEAIIQHENGMQPYTDDQLDEALRRVGVVRPVSTAAAVAADPGVRQGTIAATLATVSGAVASAAPIWDFFAERGVDPRWLIGLAVAGIVAYAAIRVAKILGARKAGLA